MSRTAVLHALADAFLTVEQPHLVRVAIDASDAAGRTTLADDVAAVIAPRYRRGPGSPERYCLDSFDTPRVRAAVRTAWLNRRSPLPA